jgi:gliding motility-associated-like protein
MDSLTAVECAPRELRLVFAKPIDCSSIAANGSDFVVNGTYPVAVTSARGNCSAGSTREIVLSLSAPLEQKGDFAIVLRRGTDGNTLVDECAQETPAGSSLSFSVKDVVHADFTHNLRYGCSIDTVNFFHPGGNDINSWQWKLDENKISTLQNPQALYTVFNQKNIELTVSNGFCSDVATASINLDNFLKADFAVVPDNCPLEPIAFANNSVGKIASHNWSFGDGNNSVEQSPKHIYQQPQRETPFQVRYTVTDSLGCQKTVTKPIKIYSSCTIYIPNAFTPGNDGRNDVFRVLNAVKAENFEWQIYNRWGQLIYQTKNWAQGWDGKYKGQLQPSGTYVWMLQYTDSRTGEKVNGKGSFVLIR